MTAMDPASTRRPGRAAIGSWLAVSTYFIVFFASMTLAGFLFMLGGIAIVLVPGSLPAPVEVGYIVFGIIGSVVIALLVANGAFRVMVRERTGQSATAIRRPPPALTWIAGIAGTVIASVLSAVLGAVILRWLGQ
jgi:hypothetical protein